MNDAKEKNWQGALPDIAILRKQARRSGFPIPAPRSRRMLRNINRRARRRFNAVTRANRDRLIRGEITVEDHLEFIHRAVAEKIDRCTKVFTLLGISKAVEKAISKGGRASLKIQSRRCGMAIASTESILPGLYCAEDETPPGYAMSSQARAGLASGIDDGSKMVVAGQCMGPRLDRPQPGKSPLAWATCSKGSMEYGTQDQ